MELHKKWWFWLILGTVLVFGFLYVRKQRMLAAGSSGTSASPLTPVPTVTGA